jgi:hypothetical protein
MSRAGVGRLSLNVNGPVHTDIQTSDNGNGTCNVVYVPVVKGSYKISVLLDDQHVTGEFFQTVL